MDRTIISFLNILFIIYKTTVPFNNGGNEYEKSIFLASLISIPFLLCVCQTLDNVKETSSTEITTSKKYSNYKNMDIPVVQFYEESRFWGYDGRTGVYTSGYFLIMPGLSLKNAGTSDDWINQEEIIMNQYIVGDYFRFIVGYEKEGKLGNAFNFEGGSCDSGYDVYEEVSSCTYYPCEIIRIDEKDITRDEDGYIQNISTGDYNIDSHAKLDIVTIDLPNNPHEYNAFSYLNKYKGDVYASVQEGVIYSFLSYDPTNERNNGIREISL